MAPPVNRIDAMRASPASPLNHDNGGDDPFGLNDFEEELRKLANANQELLDEFERQPDMQAVTTIAAASELAPADTERLEVLMLENAELRARVQELEALAAGEGDELWLERQREYEMLLEEKSDVIRHLHQKIQESQEAQESAIGGDSVPATNMNCSGTRLGQAEEILRLKREMEEQRRQLERDEEEMMSQMRQMEMMMAKERAEMARQRQEVQRLQADLAREIENSSRDPELRERLHSLRRTQEAKPTPAPILISAVKPGKPGDQKSSGFFRRMFG
jgi:hypothetical protein